MDKNSIILEVFKRSDISNYINSLSAKSELNLADDLRSELFVVLLGLDEKVLKLKYKSDHFTQYVKAIAKTIWRSNKFRKQFRKPIANVIDFADEDGNNIIDEIVPTADHNLESYYELEEVIKKLPQLNGEVLNIYLENNCSVRRASDETGIPRKYLTDSLNEVREFIQERYQCPEDDTNVVRLSGRTFEASEDVEDWEAENYNSNPVITYAKR